MTHLNSRNFPLCYLSTSLTRRRACRAGKLWQRRLSPILMNALNNSPSKEHRRKNVMVREGGVNEWTKGGTAGSGPADRNRPRSGPKSSHSFHSNVCIVARIRVYVTNHAYIMFSLYILCYVYAVHILRKATD